VVCQNLLAILNRVGDESSPRVVRSIAVLLLSECRDRSDQSTAQVCQAGSEGPRHDPRRLLRKLCGT